MPEFRGKKTTNEVLSEKRVTSWKSVTLNKTSVDDVGLIDLCQRAAGLRELHIVSDLITDKAMDAICSLQSLVSLLMDGVPHVTDLGVSHVSRVKGLRELYLNGTQLTDNGITVKTSARNLWSLFLRDTRITDVGVSRLREGPALRILGLNGNRIHGSTLAELNLADRASLYLRKCPVDDSAVVKLVQAHQKLEILDLSDTLVTDECMAAIASLAGLCEIQLTGTAISDAGIQQLHNHPTLSMVYLENTSVSDDAVFELRSTYDRHLSIYR